MFFFLLGYTSLFAERAGSGRSLCGDSEDDFGIQDIIIPPDMEHGNLYVFYLFIVTI